MRASGQEKAERWLELRTKFMQLAAEESNSVRAGEHYYLQAEFTYEGSSECGVWKLGGDASEDLQESFRTLAATAAKMLDARPQSTDLVDFWLHQLFLYLWKIKSEELLVPHPNDRELWVPKEDGTGRDVFGTPKQGSIRRVCLTSATLCSRLQRQALEQSDGVGTTTECAEATPTQWRDIEITFLSDERITVCHSGTRATYNYNEFNFEDRRDGKPSFAWSVLRDMANKNGTLPRPVAGKGRASVQKGIEAIRKKLRHRFGIQTDPIPFNGDTYQTSFKLGCAAAFDT